MEAGAAAPGLASMVLIVELIRTMVWRRVISLADAREMVDRALLTAEQQFGTTNIGDPVRELIAALLKDIDQTPSA